VLSLLAACASPVPGGSSCPAAPVPLARIADSLPLRTQVRLGSAGDGTAAEVAAEAVQGELVLVGLAPFGARLFAIRAAGAAPRVERAALAPVGPPPLHVLDAVQRVFWLQPPVPPRPGEAVRFRHGVEEVEELGLADGGRERRFRRADRDDVVRVVLSSPAARPARARIENPWCGYSGRVVALGSPPGSEPEREAR